MNAIVKITLRKNGKIVSTRFSSAVTKYHNDIKKVIELIAESFDDHFYDISDISTQLKLRCKRALASSDTDYCDAVLCELYMMSDALNIN